MRHIMSLILLLLSLLLLLLLLKIIIIISSSSSSSSIIIIIIIIISLDRTWYLCLNKSRFLLEIILVGDIPMMAPSYFSDINGLSSYQE